MTEGNWPPTTARRVGGHLELRHEDWRQAKRQEGKASYEGCQGQLMKARRKCLILIGPGIKGKHKLPQTAE